MIRRLLFSGGQSDMFEGIAALILRLGLGMTMLCFHGWGKLSTFSAKAGSFPDPLRLGSSTSLSLAVMAEAGCSALIILGLATRVALVPLIFTMMIAFFVIHGGDPMQKKELALIYMLGFTSLWFLGAGRYSLDSKLGS